MLVFGNQVDLLWPSPAATCQLACSPLVPWEPNYNSHQSVPTVPKPSDHGPLSTPSHEGLSQDSASPSAFVKTRGTPAAPEVVEQDSDERMSRHISLRNISIRLPHFLQSNCCVSPRALDGIELTRYSVNTVYLFTLTCIQEQTENSASIPHTTQTTVRQQPKVTDQSAIPWSKRYTLKPKLFCIGT